MMKRHGVQALLLTTALVVASPAFAQAAAPADESAAQTAAEEDTSPGDIVVTAQRRSESVQRLPMAITALNSEMLDQRGINSTASLQFAVPSLQVGTILGQTALTIRGVGLNQGSPGVAIHIDGVYQSRPSMGDLLQIDIQRVEVLRGPQGTLYGRNANGGVVNFITNPPTDRFEGYVLGSYANYDEARLQGVINIPVTDKIRMRGVFDWNRRGEGFVRNVLPGGQDVARGESVAGRVRVALDLAPNLTFDLSTNFLSGSGPTQYFTLHNPPSAAAVTANPLLGTATYSLKPWETASNDPINTDRAFFMMGGTLTWDLGDVTLKSITGYTRLHDDSVADDDSTSATLFPVHREYLSHTFTQEFNATARVSMFDIVAGLYYLHDDLDHTLDYNFLNGISPGLPGGLPPRSHLIFRIPSYTTKVQSAFADVTVHPTERLSLFAGLRFSDETQRQTQHNTAVLNAIGLTIQTCALRTNEVNFQSTTPRFGARYEFSNDVSVFATYARGFKAGGFNLYGCNNPYNPERLTSFEGGIKTRLFDRTLTLNLSAFHYDYKDLQISQVVGLTRRITNAAAATVNGAEIEASWRPDDHWTFDANVALLDATYESFSNIDGLAPGLGLQVLNGNRLNQSPKVASNFGVGYRTTPADFGTLSFRADVSQRSRQYFREFNGPLDSQDGYALLNGSITWQSPDEKYQVRLFGTNLTNKPYISRMDSSDSLGARFISWGAPRQYGVELRARF